MITPIKSTVTLIFAAACFVTTSLNAKAQQVVELTLGPMAVPSHSDAIRLLPREHELRDGNAAIELLRMPWEQSNFVDLSRKSMNDWLEMKGDDPELTQWESAFAVFKKKMRRAAYTRSADWDYPLFEQPLPTILLPDVQGMREYVGRVLTLWIRIQIAKGDLKAAEEGLLIQMACAQHVSRTPIVVCQLVGAAIAHISLGELEKLIQLPESENLYYSLGMLPDSTGDFESAIDLDFHMLRSSMPSLTDQPLPKPGSPIWKTAFAELSANYITLFTMSEEIAPELLKKQAKIAFNELALSKTFSTAEINSMTGEEAITRWLMAVSKDINSKYIAAIQLPMHESIQELARLGKEVDKLNEKILFEQQGPVPDGATKRVNFFNLCSARSYLACHRLGRKAKLLQIVEAIRHHLSQNNNKLPDSLDEIDLRIPKDPFTNQPAVYSRDGETATLNWPDIPNLDPKLNRDQSPQYNLKLAKRSE